LASWVPGGLTTSTPLTGVPPSCGDGGEHEGGGGGRDGRVGEVRGGGDGGVVPCVSGESCPLAVASSADGNEIKRYLFRH